MGVLGVRTVVKRTHPVGPPSGGVLLRKNEAASINAIDLQSGLSVHAHMHSSQSRAYSTHVACSDPIGDEGGGGGRPPAWTIASTYEEFGAKPRAHRPVEASCAFIAVTWTSATPELGMRYQHGDR